MWGFEESILNNLKTSSEATIIKLTQEFFMIQLTQVSAQQKATRLFKNTLNIKGELNNLCKSKYSNPRVSFLQV